MSTTATPGYPITFEFDPPAKIARWRPLVHWLLVIPHMLVLFVMGIVVEILAFVAWILGVFTGKIPEGIQTFIALYVRYSVRTNVYRLYLQEEYPPFSFDTTFQDPRNYPRTTLDVRPQLEGRNRLTIFFRYFMILPHAIVLLFVLIGYMFVLFIGFFAVIITGNWPTGLRNYVIGTIRWTTRVTAYFLLLTDEYPPFGFK